MRNVGFALFLLSIVAVGCNKGPVVVVTDPGPYQAPQGAVVAKSSDGAVSIMVPNGWRRGGPGSMVMPSLGEVMGGMGSESMGGDMQSLANQMQQDETAAEAQAAAELEKKGILIWVNNSSRPIPGEERTSYRIKRTDDGPKSLEDAATAAKDGIINEGPVQYVDLPIGKVARFEAKTTKIDGGELFQIVYVIVNGEHIYNVRFVTQEAPTVVQQIEKDVMESLRITPAKSS